MRLARPQKATGAPVAVRVLGWQVVVKSPQKYSTVIDACKERGYRWDNTTWSWRLKVTSELGAPEDRAAEVAHTILSAGIPVESDDAIIEKALAASFDPIHPRWVSAGTGKWDGWLMVSIADDGEDARKAKAWLDAIGRRSYYRKAWYVNPEAWREVYDIAAQHDVRIAPQADAMLQAARAKEVAELLPVEHLPPAPTAVVKPAAAKDIGHDGIDPALRDE